MSLRIVFMGTGNLALPSFLALRDSKHTLVGLVTQPDRVGRGHHQHVNPVKTAAVERGIPVLQPDSIKTAEAIADLKALTPDLCVVAAYGQMLSIDVLKVPQHGTINIHASLLPQYRGATPIHAAILNGDAETGVTIIEIEQKMDYYLKNHDAYLAKQSAGYNFIKTRDGTNHAVAQSFIDSIRIAFPDAS